MNKLTKEKDPIKLGEWKCVDERFPGLFGLYGELDGEVYYHIFTTMELKRSISRSSMLDQLVVPLDDGSKVDEECPIEEEEDFDGADDEIEIEFIPEV